MKLSERQIDALSAVWEGHNRQIHDDYCVGLRRSLNVLYREGYVTMFTYANGDFWSLTDKGLDKVNSILKQRNLI